MLINSKCIDTITERRRSKLLCSFILLVGVGIISQLWTTIAEAEEQSESPESKGVVDISSSTSKRTKAQSLLPTCNPHWKVQLTTEADKRDHHVPIQHILWSDTAPVKRLFFYHVRKAGGTMIRSYIQKVASHYKLNLHMQEVKHASFHEEVGSRNDTIYITNIRDPVERSISHFKYEGRWDCRQMIHNKSYVATLDNARDFREWNETHGFVPSECDVPFVFTKCAVQCYIQTFSGAGCTLDDWMSEYNLAFERLCNYNLILVYDNFKDPSYVNAIEEFFGVKGFNKHHEEMFCGPQSWEANKRVPLKTSYEHMLKLEYANHMDNRLYKDLVSSCGWNAKTEEYAFPRVDTSRFVARENRTVVDV